MRGLGAEPPGLTADVDGATGLGIADMGWLRFKRDGPSPCGDGRGNTTVPATRQGSRYVHVR
jgi:hypothetical protein